MAQVLAIKPGRLKAAHRKALQAADIIVLELDDPTELRLVEVEGSELSCSELSWAAIAAIDDHGISTTAQGFVKNVRSLVAKKLRKAASANSEKENPDG